MNGIRRLIGDNDPRVHERARELLEDPQLRAAFWKLSRRARRHQVEARGLPRWAARGKVRTGLRAILFTVLSSGGPVHAIRRGDLLARRRRIAVAARRLAVALANDPFAAEVPALMLLNGNSQGPGFEAEQLAYLVRRSFAAELRGLGDRAEDGVALTHSVIEHAALDPSTYAGDGAQRRQLERRLASELRQLTGSPCDWFSAAAVTAVFDEPVTPAEIGARRRSRAGEER